MSSSCRALTAVVLAVLLTVSAVWPQPVYALDFKRAAITALVCAGSAYGGYKLGEQIAQLQIIKKQLTGVAAERMTKSITIGMAAALCGTSILLTNSVYGKLSKRDRDARAKEMQAALENAEPNTRTYVLPDSKMPGTLTTEAPEMDGDRECRYQVDVLSKDGEPARAKFCRKSAKDKYEVDLGV